ncbi:MAG: SelT/SelW/SelH family protein [Candidatus Latescibacteria bacterium]|nr:Rdx family protein [bacterium]MCB9513338.1 SelT/SelW/SelH family protein [Candidatus Latescibacterota bacterium]MCB9516051.1 SelT/SelW/SelH family protein [Candidatus Latescibacterota bacterium]
MAAAIQERFDVTPEMIRSGGGVFEVTVGGRLVFSKKAEGRFPEDEEIFAAIAAAR